MHVSVLLDETVRHVVRRDGGGVYIDATVGGGGHAEALLEAAGAGARLLGIDRDPEAIARCEKRLSRFGERVTLAHADFAQMRGVAESRGFAEVDGIVMDLGVSSFQLDEAARGFSFMNDGPLDMRMDNSRGATAAELLDSFGEDWRALADVLREFGEEPAAAKIAKAILAEHRAARIETTARLAAVVEKAVGGRKGQPRHPGTRTFQALRMAVNRETEQVARGVEAAVSLLAPEGILAVISFHSIEDRIVKHTLAEHEGRWESLQQGGRAWHGREPAVARVARRPVTPSEQELTNNPRARSAKLRVVRRVATPKD